MASTLPAFFLSCSVFLEQQTDRGGSGRSVVQLKQAAAGVVAAAGEFPQSLAVSAPVARPWLAIPDLAACVATIDHGFPVAIALAWHQVDLHRLGRSAGGAIEHRGKGVADLLNLFRK
jgi:hypothetical protein